MHFRKKSRGNRAKVHFNRYDHILAPACGIPFPKDQIVPTNDPVDCGGCLKVLEYRKQLQSLGRTS